MIIVKHVNITLCVQNMWFFYLLIIVNVILRIYISIKTY